MDRLIEAIDNTQNPSVVGLDPTEALVPPQVVASFADEVRDSVESPEELESAQLAVAYFEYNRTIIDAIAVLVRTSNPSSSELQMLDLADGTKVYEHVADLVEGWGAETIGDHGYSRVGAVVGATHPEEGKALRARMPHTFFLVPGYGAQGGTAADVAGMFDEQGSGAIVNSSRGIIGAWKKSGKYSESMTADEALGLVADSARQAALDMRDNLRVAVYR